MFNSIWLGGRDSNPDSQIQSLESYHWTTSQQRNLNLRIEATVVKFRVTQKRAYALVGDARDLELACGR